MNKRVVYVLLAGALIVFTASARARNWVHLPHRQSVNTALPRGGQTQVGLLRIPANTEVRVSILSGIQTHFSRRDDSVVAQVTRPVYIRGEMALPMGTVFSGRVTQIHPARRVGRAAELAIHFESVMLPNGETRPVSAIVSALDSGKTLGVRVNSEGQMRAVKPRLWKRLAGGFVGAGGFAIARLAFAGSTALAVGLPAGGAAYIGYVFLWRRGRDINLPPQTRARIRLINSLTVNSVV